MPMPEGARMVHYDIRVYDTSSGVETSIQLRMDVGLDNVMPTAVAAEADAAVQAGADAIRSHLAGVYPQGTVTALRTYDLSVPGDPWPAGAQPLGGE